MGKKVTTIRCGFCSPFLRKKLRFFCAKSVLNYSPPCPLIGYVSKPTLETHLSEKTMIKILHTGTRCGDVIQYCKWRRPVSTLSNIFYQIRGFRALAALIPLDKW